jgi:hypothetical protein
MQGIEIRDSPQAFFQFGCATIRGNVSRKKSAPGQ